MRSGMLKPIIIGQAPARGNEHKPPFSGKSGARLARLAGVGDTGDVLPQYFDLYNILDYWPGKAVKGDAFDMTEGAAKGRQLMLDLFQLYTSRRILLMGRKVRRCMGVQGSQREYLEWFQFGPHQACIFPHPSGVNQWWNDSVNTARARVLIQGALYGPSPKG
jgi:uracil-DNA glycosylase